MSKAKIFYGILGEFQTGKSLLINCLLKRSIAVVGDGRATTHTIVKYLYSKEEYAEYIDEEGCLHKTNIDKVQTLQRDPSVKQICIFIDNDLLMDFSLIDMPGLGYNETDNAFAKSTLKDIDCAIMVAPNYKAIGGEDSPYYRDVTILMQNGIPYYLFLNCTDTDKWNPDNAFNENIFKANLNFLSFYKPLSYPFEKDDLLVVNFLWYWLSLKFCDNRNNSFFLDKDVQLKRHNRSLHDYGLYDDELTKSDIYEASNFEYIIKLFSMDSRLYQEIRKEIRELKEELCPIGTIQTFAFDKIPKGWLPCDGNAIEIDSFPELFAAIGITFGGDGEKLFCLPDLRDRFVRGWDMNKKNRKFGSPQEDSLQGHSHQFEVKDLAIEKSGGHTHLFRPEKGNTANPKLFSDTYMVEKFSNEHDKTFSYHTSYNGDHSHKIAATNNPISNPKSTTYGNVRIDKETRPKNLALLYCIRAI